MATIRISGYLADDTTAFSYEIRPNDIQSNIKNYTEDIHGLDGTFHRFHRAYKHNFKLTFNNVQSGIANTLYTIFTTPNQMVFQNIDGINYTVMTDADSFSSTIAGNSVALRKDSNGERIKLYTVSLNLVEK
jgi:hypothetical protein